MGWVAVLGFSGRGEKREVVVGEKWTRWRKRLAGDGLSHRTLVTRHSSIGRVEAGEVGGRETCGGLVVGGRGMGVVQGKMQEKYG